MRIVVHPQRGFYRLLFIRGDYVRGVGQVTISQTPKGPRPKNFLYRKQGKKHPRPAPTKDLISALREGEVQLTAPDTHFLAFLSDHQIASSEVKCCRICLLEDRFTPIAMGEGVKSDHETICYDCALKELRREIGYLGSFGRRSMEHIGALLSLYRDVNRVLAALQPEQLDTHLTLFDRLDVTKVEETSRLDDLPLPELFRMHAGVERLRPVQQLALDKGLLAGKDLLVVSATASGKTFIGEMAGIRNYLEGRGRMLFLVPLVALANQKYQRFRERYGSFLRVSLHTGVSRLNLPETRAVGERDIEAAIVVGTYEGIDHHLRTGQRIRNVGTIVIDEVQMLEDPDRGHRLDGLIARLKELAPGAQFLYLSATIGVPHLLAMKLDAELVTYAERPVPLERHLIFVGRQHKIRYIKQLVEDAFRRQSSKGSRGQTIVFTNSRARCYVIAEALGRRAAPYHAGLTSRERHEVEEKFSTGALAAVVTTSALGAGVDFPASQVIFDSLAMGIEWLSVQEFHQMSGRAGRPDFHDQGRVVILAEPGGSYSRESSNTEEEVALALLKGEMEEVAPLYDLEESSEEFVANAVVCNGEIGILERMNQRMVGRAEPPLDALLAKGLIQRSDGRYIITPLARVMAEHFIGLERLDQLRKMAEKTEDSLGILVELEALEEDRSEYRKGKGRR
ncbi:MAG: DEAD/DEAH box helicase [Methanomicrobiales archaeon]|nr:DEAD/DEAH box helicase [Methanomicrobiales archaeon]